MMVELMDPSSDEVICDPACGTSGFLVASGEYLKEKKKDEIFFDRQKKDHYMNHMFHGFDMDRTMLRIGAMNMMTHGIDNPFIEYRDSLSDQNPDRDKYTLILANPPFKGSLDADIVSADLLKVCKTKKTELLFLALFLRMLKVGGRGAVIVPDGVLFGSSKAHRDIRRELVENHRLEAVISIEIRGQRAADCEQGCETAAEVLLERLPAGIRPGELNWEALTWERETGLFLRRGRLRCRAYFLARAEEGDTVFLDFRLKGAVTT